MVYACCDMGEIHDHVLVFDVIMIRDYMLRMTNVVVIYGRTPGDMLDHDVAITSHI